MKTSGGEVRISSWSRGIEGEIGYSRGEREEQGSEKACISGEDGIEEQTIVREYEAVSSSKLLVAKGEKERGREMDVFGQRVKVENVRLWCLLGHPGLG